MNNFNKPGLEAGVLAPLPKEKFNFSSDELKINYQTNTQIYYSPDQVLKLEFIKVNEVVNICLLVRNQISYFTKIYLP